MKFKAIEAARDGGCKELAILHCVSGYPAPAEDYNLRTLIDMQKRFKLVTGLSDHTIDNTIAIASVALGASIIEKHVTLDRNGGGPDDSFSLEPKELKQLCAGAKIAWESMGQVDYGRKSSESGSIKYRRSLFFSENLEAGEIVTKGNIRSIRPGNGLAPKHFEKILGLKVNRPISRGSPVNWGDFI
jgi:sialic acid synthase SpsE